MTKIEWTDKTWNPVTGCTKISPGCKNCYAHTMANRLAGRFGYPEPPDQFKVTLQWDRIDQLMHWKKPRMVFVCSMGDLFHKDVPFWYVDAVFGRMYAYERHTFQVLTKRPDRMLDYFNWTKHHFFSRNVPLPNVWLGVSVEDQDHLRRVVKLLQCPAAVHFVSLEPLLSRMDLSRLVIPGRYPRARTIYNFIDRTRYDIDFHGFGVGAPLGPRLDWVIIGGESGPGSRPMDPQWAKIVVAQCKATGIPVFVKQMGKAWAVQHNPFDDRLTTVWQQGDTKGATMEYWPEDLRVREYPAGVSE